VPSNIRNLRTLRVSRKGHEVVIIAEGNGFLYKMVRSLAGYLIRAGHGDLSAEDGREILASRVRTARIPTAPPQGLFLWKVDYAK
jgi:tRNA pseudouridine38-40 synthase